MQKDLTGRIFGRLLVVAYGGRNSYKNHQWICKCDCGEIKITVTQSLVKGATRSCGCLLREMSRKSGKRPKTERVIDMTGRIICRWLVICRMPHDKKRTTKWLCQCNCGNHKIVSGDTLPRGDSRSCGCLTVDRLRGHKFFVTHGLCRSPEYATWSAMRARVQNPNTKNYQGYGGRGITLCERWEKFENFYEDMGPRPTPQHTLDRIDNDGPYCPENCRWATVTEQAENRRSTIRLTHQGKTQSATAWAREFGVSGRRVRSRARKGMTIEEIIADLKEKD